MMGAPQNEKWSRKVRGYYLDHPPHTTKEETRILFTLGNVGLIDPSSHYLIRVAYAVMPQFKCHTLFNSTLSTK